MEVCLSNKSKKYLLFVFMIFVGSGLVFVLGPVIRCAYKHYRFESWMRVEVDISSCEDPMSGAHGERCRYLFAFEGEKSPETFQFTGSGLKYAYDSARRQFSTTGMGLITHKGSHITVDNAHIYFNDQRLPVGGTIPIRVLVKKDGQVVSGFCEVRW